jgi:hypothetical protein
MRHSAHEHSNENERDQSRRDAVVLQVERRGGLEFMAFEMN